MTNEELEARLDELVSEERLITREVLQLILLAEERKLYLIRGCDSTVRWLVKRYRYSETAALRRVQAARLLRAVPDVDLKLQTGDVNLSTLAKAQSILRAEEKRLGERLSPERKAQAVTAIEGQSEAIAERALAQRFPETMERVKREHVRLVADDAVRLSLTLPRKTYDLVLEIRDFLGHAVPEGDLPSIVDYVFNDYKKRKDSRATRRATAPVALPVNVRRAVFQRDQGRCQYRDPVTGQICGSRRRVEIDHIKPRALGGSDHFENLRCLCRLHNAFRAEQTFGKRR